MDHHHHNSFDDRSPRAQYIHRGEEATATV